MSDAPERIFLQDAGDYARAAAFEVTWCVEPQDVADTEYIRADKVDALVAENERLRDALVQIAGKPDYADDPWEIARTTLAELKGQDDE